MFKQLAMKLLTICFILSVTTANSLAITSSSVLEDGRYFCTEFGDIYGFDVSDACSLATCITQFAMMECNFAMDALAGCEMQYGVGAHQCNDLKLEKNAACNAARRANKKSINACNPEKEVQLKSYSLSDDATLSK